MTGWVLVLVVTTSGAIPSATVTTAPFASSLACEVALADIRRQLNPAPHLPQPPVPAPRLAGGCYPR